MTRLRSCIPVILSTLPTALNCVGGSGKPARVGPTPTTDATILSVYYGLDELRAEIARICGVGSIRDDGMPVTFSVQLENDTVVPEAFSVQTTSGEVVTPRCATLQPAAEPHELRTVLLAGPFGTPDAQPRAVEVVGTLKDIYGRSMTGLRSEDVTPLEAGPSLVLAEHFPADTPEFAEECPPSTRQIVQLTWQGGVTGPDGAALGEPQRQAVSIELGDGTTIRPVALGDDDPDNFVLVCIDASAPAKSVTVQAGHFHDPGDDANPQTTTEVQHP